MRFRRWLVAGLTGLALLLAGCGDSPPTAVPNYPPGDLVDDLYEAIQDHYVETDLILPERYGAAAAAAILLRVSDGRLGDNYDPPNDLESLEVSYRSIGIEVALSPHAEDPGELVRLIYEALQADGDGDPELGADAAGEAAVNAILDTLDDPYVNYLNPADYGTALENLDGRTYDGIGIQIDVRDPELGGGVIVSSFLCESPAYEAGLMRNDVIVAVDGEDMRTKALSVVVSNVLGDAGTIVMLTVERGDRLLDFAVERREISSKAVCTSLLTVDDSRFGVVRIPSFTNFTPEQMAKSLCELFGGEGCGEELCNNPTAYCGQPGGLDGLIVDLRTNPGGFVSSTLSSAAQLLPDDGDLPLLHERRPRNDRRVHTIDDAAPSIRYPDMPPVAILVNEGSASGSEVFTAALRDHGRAIVVGEADTFGKGSVNRFVSLGNGGGVYLTIARWFSPCGELIEGQGITPDYNGATPEDAARLLLSSPAPAPRCEQFDGPS